MPPTSFSPDYFYFSLSARCWLAYSDGEREDRRRKGNEKKKKKKEPKHPFHHSRDNLTVTLRAIPGRIRRKKREKRTVSDKSPPAPEKQLSKKRHSKIKMKTFK